ncbi:hypothetical protein TNCV_3772411 [Trichonephila clavipes]|nr:hypothetical protein TNCV_3772411 [Trichonephila clavipes]
MTQYCQICAKGNGQPSKHAYSNDSAGNMEVVGACHIFERSNVRNVQYSEYYGDGDSKGHEAVKNFYGTNSVTKLERNGPGPRALSRSQLGLNKGDPHPNNYDRQMLLLDITKTLGNSNCTPTSNSVGLHY